MRVYIKTREETYSYPEQMEIIMNYLQRNGTLLVSGKTIENLYRDFCEDKYAAGWMIIYSEDDPILEEFSELLDRLYI